MSNSFLLIRSLFIYAVCILVAVVLGCILANWDDTLSFYTGLLILSLLLVPMLLRWHHLWLIASWNTTAVVFFLPGRPYVVLALSFASLFLSILQHALNRKQELPQVRSITLPLFFLLAVVLVTAKLTGGIGLSVFGSATVGGKKYVYLLGGIAGYFALSAQRIPPNKAFLYVAIFFLTGVTSMISDLAHFIPQSALYYILLIFPPTSWWEGNNTDFVAGAPEIGRLGGIANGAAMVLFGLMAVYGIKGIFNPRKFWRILIFIAAVIGCTFGGFRSLMIIFLLTFAAVFCLEGLPRSRYMPGMICGGLLLIAIALPFTDKLPLPVQRSLSMVPYINLDPFARGEAAGSTEWRLHLWGTLLPEVPKYLVLGKGLSINAEDLSEVSTLKSASSETDLSILAGDYHSGPLSLIIPFGLGGVIGFLWLLGAGTRALWRNYRYGDPALAQINTFLLAAFLAKILYFMIVFGSFFGDLYQFAGFLGLSVALNGGICKPALVPRKSLVPEIRFGPVPARMTA